ncbi:MAG: histidine kinase [Pseudomonadota bacterium]
MRRQLVRTSATVFEDLTSFPVLSHFWQANLAGWLFISVLGFITRGFFFSDLGSALVRTAVFDTIGFSLTCLVHLAIRRRVGLPMSAFTAIPIAFAIGVTGALIQLGVAEILGALDLIPGEFGHAVSGRYTPLMYYTFIFTGWTLAYFWLMADHAVRAAKVQRSEAESMAARAELQQLRIQLDPHFLFNALNTVTVEIPDRPDIALEMTRRICDYMRYSLDHQARSVCPLSDEIDAVRAYLRIQELRYDGRLACTVRLQPEAGDFPVPHLILQGLVENAVKHSLGPDTHQPLPITVDARLDQGRLSIVVTNPGTYVRCLRAVRRGSGPDLPRQGGELARGI